MRACMRSCMRADVCACLCVCVCVRVCVCDEYRLVLNADQLRFVFVYNVWYVVLSSFLADCTYKY